MRVAIMQPYFFPYVGYFSLIDYADRFVVLDTVQYDRKSWMNRNRILGNDGQWHYIRAQVTKPRFTAQISDVRLSHDDEWKERILRQLDSYRHRAPYFRVVVSLVREVLFQRRHTSLVSLNVTALQSVCDYLGLQYDICVFSEMNLSIGTIDHPGQWALQISRAMGADEYVNPPGGAQLFDDSEFGDAGIDLLFLKNSLQRYHQHGTEFVPALSIIDVLMHNSSTEARELVASYETMRKSEINA